MQASANKKLLQTILPILLTAIPDLSIGFLGLGAPGRHAWARKICWVAVDLRCGCIAALHAVDAELEWYRTYHRCDLQTALLGVCAFYSRERDRKFYSRSASVVPVRR
jgi:hypothetical protein